MKQKGRGDAVSSTSCGPEQVRLPAAAGEGKAASHPSGSPGACAVTWTC